MQEKPSQVGKTIFSAHAASYTKGRPGYAPEATAFLREHLGRAGTGADIGSGTGIFTRELLDMGHKVYAVEPNRDMRLLGEEQLSHREGFISVAARAEDTGLADKSLDFITAASSFHWLDHEMFRREALRTLTREGEVFVLFNDRSIDDPFSREQHAICREFCPRFTSLAHGWAEALEAFPGFFGTGAKFKYFDFAIPYSREAFLNRSFSSSYSLTEGDADFEPYSKALEAAVDRYFPDGGILIPNVTRLCYGRPRE